MSLIASHNLTLGLILKFADGNENLGGQSDV